jgi:hypothetical protein
MTSTSTPQSASLVAGCTCTHSARVIRRVNGRSR